jgi:hypothetical protein
MSIFTACYWQAGMWMVIHQSSGQLLLVAFLVHLTVSRSMVRVDDITLIVGGRRTLPIYHGILRIKLRNAC